MAWNEIKNGVLPPNRKQVFISDGESYGTGEYVRDWRETVFEKEADVWFVDGVNYFEPTKWKYLDD